MTKQNHTVALLLRQMTGERRVAVLKGFREGGEKLLITDKTLWSIYFEAVNSARGCNQTIGCDMFQCLSEKREFE